MRNRALRHASNRVLIEEAKAVPCVDCGRSLPTEQMDFDHVRGEKRSNIASMAWHVSTSVLIAEIAKCEIVCAVCHRVRTRRQVNAGGGSS